MIKLKYALFLLLISQGHSFINCMDDEFGFAFDDILEEDTREDALQTGVTEDESFMDSEATIQELALHNQEPLTACQAVNILTNPDQGINAQILLQEDLYRRTNPNNSRSLLNLPGFYHHYFYPQDCYFWTQLFYNQTSNGYYTKESTQLQSYILLNNPNLIQIIDDQELPGIEIPSILAIFSNMKLQERRLGLMFGGQHVWSDWHVRAYAPFYYLERNLSLTDEERTLLERAGLPPIEDPIAVARDHVIIDKLGIGDSRVELGYTPLESDIFLARIGGLFTIPTAYAFKNGLYGTHFSKSTPAPKFSLLDFLNTIITDKNPTEAALQAEEFLLAAVDRLSTIVLETGMGNEGHFGLGVFADNEIVLSDSWTLRSKSSLEYLTPKFEKRFYIMKKTQEEFERNYTTTVPEIVCEENLAFLNEQLIETLFPTMYPTRISPGYIFLWNTSLTYQGEKMDFQFGYDLYWQDKEKLGTINGTPEQVARLRTDIAVKPGAYQTKLFGDFLYKKHGRNREFHFGFHLDATLLSSGIGRDFTAAFYVDMTI